MVPTDHQQAELLEVEQGVGQVGQLVFIQEKTLELFQPREGEKGLKRTAGLRVNTKDTAAKKKKALLSSGHPCSLGTNKFVAR